jgi:hypothetical protein
MGNLPIIPILCAVIGALVYALTQNGKAAELGRGAYWVGIFWVLAHFANWPR